MPKNLSVALRKEQIFGILKVTTNDEFEEKRRKGNAARELNKVVTEVWNNQEKYFKTDLKEQGMKKLQLQNKITPMLKHLGPESVIVFQFQSSRKSRSNTNLDDVAPNKVSRTSPDQRMDMSIDESLDMSLDQSMEQSETALQKELEELRDFKKKFEPLSELFARHSKNRYAVGTKIYEIGISLLGEAFSATDIAKMFSCLARISNQIDSYS